jgi:carbon storage regulator
MLVLARKIGESVVIDGRIVVRVVGAGGGRARLGIEAPDDVLILRSEVAARLALPDDVVELTPELVPVG